MFGEYGPDMWGLGLALGYAMLVWIALEIAARRGWSLYPRPRPRHRELEGVSQERSEFF